MNVTDTLRHVEDLGRQRGCKSRDILEEGGQPSDTFTHEGMAIHHPWWSSCGRFVVDPYQTYGREFVLWLLEPFYFDDDIEGTEAKIMRQLLEKIPQQGVGA